MLLTYPNDSSQSVYPVIADFGLSRQLQQRQLSFSGKSGAIGTFQWMAPEVMNHSHLMVLIIYVVTLFRVVETSLCYNLLGVVSFDFKIC